MKMYVTVEVQLHALYLQVVSEWLHGPEALFPWKEVLL